MRTNEKKIIRKNNNAQNIYKCKFQKSKIIELTIGLD